MGKKPERLAGRNGLIWAHYVRGTTQEALAERFGLSQQRVSQIIEDVRTSIPQIIREQVIQAELDLLMGLRAEILEIWDAEPAPLMGRDGEVVCNPESGEIVRDHSGRLAAAKMAVNVSESLRRMLGLDAAQKVDVGLGEQHAAEEAAVEALRRLAEEGEEK